MSVSRPVALSDEVALPALFAVGGFADGVLTDDELDNRGLQTPGLVEAVVGVQRSKGVRIAQQYSSNPELQGFKEIAFKIAFALLVVPKSV